MDAQTRETLRAKSAHLRTCLSRMREAENPNTHSSNEYVGRLNRLALAMAVDLSSLLDALPELLALAEAPLAGATGTWQPIETLNVYVMNDKEFLVGFANGAVRLVRWSKRGTILLTVPGLWNVQGATCWMQVAPRSTGAQAGEA